MKLSLIFVLLGVILFSCSQHKDSVSMPEKKAKMQEPLIKVNKELAERDEEVIKKYISRKHYKMEQTGTGLWFQVVNKGEGKKAETGKNATINYKISLLDGTLCYTSDSLGPKTFLISQGGVETGLEEGILLLHEGDKARFIMPPHLAHGLIGDDKKIPPRAILVYEVELLKLSN